MKGAIVLACVIVLVFLCCVVEAYTKTNRKSLGLSSICKFFDPKLLKHYKLYSNTPTLIQCQPIIGEISMLDAYF